MKSLSNRLVRAAATGVVGLGVAFTALGVTSNSAQAATQIVVGDQLTGATGVNLGITLGFFDVSFVDGTCSDLFGGCDEVSDFNFNNLTDATLAAQALLDQVFLDTTDGQFDTDPELTTGCTSLSRCIASIPFGFSFGTIVAHRGARNSFSEAGDSLFSFGDDNFDSSHLTEFTYALFTPVTPIPVPAALPLFGTGLGILGFLGWRRRRKAAEAA